MLNRRFTADLGSADACQYLKGMPQLAASGAVVDVTGTTVTFDGLTLVILADLPDDYDGYFCDGFIWIGGTEYPVEAVIPPCQHESAMHGAPPGWEDLTDVQRTLLIRAQKTAMFGTSEAILGALDAIDAPYCDKSAIAFYLTGRCL